MREEEEGGFKNGISLGVGYSWRTKGKPNAHNYQLTDDWNICYIYTPSLPLFWICSGSTQNIFIILLFSFFSFCSWWNRSRCFWRSWFLPWWMEGVGPDLGFPFNEPKPTANGCKLQSIFFRANYICLFLCYLYLTLCGPQEKKYGLKYVKLSEIYM